MFLQAVVARSQAEIMADGGIHFDRASVGADNHHKTHLAALHGMQRGKYEP